MKKLKTFLFLAFMRVNPTVLVIVLLSSYFNEKLALTILQGERWLLIITFVLAIPQMVVNYKSKKE